MWPSKVFVVDRLSIFIVVIMYLNLFHLFIDFERSDEYIDFTTVCDFFARLQTIFLSETLFFVEFWI